MPEYADTKEQRELRTIAVSISAQIHSAPTIRLSDSEKSQALGARILADAKAFETFMASGKIPAEYELKPDGTDG